MSTTVHCTCRVADYDRFRPGLIRLETWEREPIPAGGRNTPAGRAGASPVATSARLSGPGRAVITGGWGRAPGREVAGGWQRRPPGAAAAGLPGVAPHARPGIGDYRGDRA